MPVNECLPLFVGNDSANSSRACRRHALRVTPVPCTSCVRTIVPPLISDSTLTRNVASIMFIVFVLVFVCHFHFPASTRLIRGQIVVDEYVFIFSIQFVNIFQ